jgi:hypothetical protein
MSSVLRAASPDQRSVRDRRRRLPAWTLSSGRRSGGRVPGAVQDVHPRPDPQPIPCNETMQSPFVADKPITAAARLGLAAPPRAVQRRRFGAVHPPPARGRRAAERPRYEDAVVAADLLHDLVEDTETTFGRGTRALRIKGRRTGFRGDSGSLDRGLPRAQGGAASRSRGNGRDAAAVFAADKIVKARELRGQASRPGLRLRSRR